MAETAEDTISRLMHENADALKRMAFLYLHDRELAEDAVQEAFLKAFAKLHTFRGDASEKSWLTKITINICKDLRRAPFFRLVDRSKSTDELALLSPEQNSDDTVICAIMSLKPHDKEVILLKYYQNFSTAEIAQILRIPASTVSSRLKRAKERLGAKLKGWYLDEE